MGGADAAAAWRRTRYPARRRPSDPLSLAIEKSSRKSWGKDTSSGSIARKEKGEGSRCLCHPATDASAWLRALFRHAPTSPAAWLAASTFDRHVHETDDETEKSSDEEFDFGDDEDQVYIDDDDDMQPVPHQQPQAQYHPPALPVPAPAPRIPRVPQQYMNPGAFQAGFGGHAFARPPASAFRRQYRAYSTAILEVQQGRSYGGGRANLMYGGKSASRSCPRSPSTSRLTCHSSLQSSCPHQRSTSSVRRVCESSSDASANAPRPARSAARHRVPRHVRDHQPRASGS